MRARELLVALLVAVALAGLAHHRMVVVTGPCAYLTPEDTWLWWWYECGKDSAGGGSSGAGD